MVPIYAIASSLSFVFYHEALYFQLGRDCYEALIIASFFNLLLAYLSSPTPLDDHSDDDTALPYLQSSTSLATKPRRESRKAQENDRKAKLREVMRDVKVGKWIWPFGWVKWRPANGGRGEGSTFLWLMRLGIMQYTILRPLTTLVRAHPLEARCRFWLHRRRLTSRLAGRGRGSFDRYVLSRIVVTCILPSPVSLTFLCSR